MDASVKTAGLESKVAEEPAKLLRRVAAKYIDTVGRISLLLSMGGLVAVGGMALSTVYEVVIPVLWQGQTIGKRLMDIRFKRVDGRPITLTTSFIRMVSELLTLPLIPLSAATGSMRSTADRIAGTVVVSCTDQRPKPGALRVSARLRSSL